LDKSGLGERAGTARWNVPLHQFFKGTAALWAMVGSMGLLAFLDSSAINQSFERADVPLRFTVIDADSGGPVSDAGVKLTEFNRSVYLAPTTGPDGQTSITIGFNCCSNSTLFSKSRRVYYSSWQVDVEAPGYATLTTALTELTGDHCFHDDTASPPRIALQLHRKAERRIGRTNHHPGLERR
jgi:hypothetical protein